MTKNLFVYTYQGLGLLAGSIFFVSWAMANEQRNANGELTIEGDSAIFVEANNSIEYAGNVIASMDGMQITGDRVLVQMNDAGVERITTTGMPASFWQEQTDAAAPTQANAETIVYLPDSSQLELSGSASLNQAGNEIRGTSIRYDIALGKLAAIGDEEKAERVRMQLLLPDNTVNGKPAAP